MIFHLFVLKEDSIDALALPPCHLWSVKTKEKKKCIGSSYQQNKGTSDSNEFKYLANLGSNYEEIFIDCLISLS